MHGRAAVGPGSRAPVPIESVPVTMRRPDGESRLERKQRTREAILDAALDLCDDGPLSSLSLRQVAREVGIVPTAFYRHFDSLDSLGLALVEESFASLRTMLREVRAGAPAFEHLIDDSLAIVREHARRRPQHFAFISRERLAGSPTVRSEIAHELELVERELATDVARLPGTQAWSNDDLRVLSALLVTVVVAAIEGIVAGRGRPEVEKQCLETARTQLRMVLVGALQWRSRG